MDISRITEKPAGRSPITTTMHKLSDLQKVLAAIARAIAAGGRVYWVCPLVNDSETLDITATELRFATLRETFGALVTMAHGQMDPARRDAALADVALRDARSVSAFRAAAQRIPQGATLLQATDTWRAADCSRAKFPFSAIGPATHLAAYATIDRAVWEPFIFAARGKQPIESTRPFARGELRSLAPPGLNDLPYPGAAKMATDGDEVPQGWPQRFDYLLVTGRGCTKNPMPGFLAPMADGPGFSLYRILQ